MRQVFSYDKNHPDLNYRLMAKLEDAQINASSFLVTHSKSHAKEVSLHYKIDVNRFKIIPHGISLENSPKIISVDISNKPKVRVLYVGRFEKRKGFEDFLRSIPLILSSQLNIHIDICGDDSEYYSSVIKRFGHNVTLHGYLSFSELEHLYRKCDIFVAPSRYESFGLVYLEAMKYGKPVVACNSGGTPEVVKDRVTGILVEPGNYKAISESVIELVKNPKLRMTLGKAGFDRTRNLFSLDQLIDSTVEYYKFGLQEITN